MLFTSLDFFLFLPLVLAVFALTPVAQRWAVLLLASYVFYGFSNPFNLIYLGAVTLVVFACGWGLAQARQRPLRVAVFVIGLVAVLGSLTAFKFWDFIAGEIEHANLLAEHQAATTGRHRAGRLLLLRLLGGKLPHRHLCRTSFGPAEPWPGGPVHRLLSQDFCRTDRAGDEFPAAAIVRATRRSRFASRSGCN